MKDLKKLYNQLKSSAKKRNIHFDLSMDDLNNLSFPITCPILDIQLKWNTGCAKDSSFSIDRIDSDKGYTIDNIVVISNRANILKRDATLLELKCLYEFYSNI